jgi:hypothetical protein
MRQTTFAVGVQKPGRPIEFGGEDSYLLGFKLRYLNLFAQ